MRPVACDKFLELMSFRLESALSKEQARELEDHLAGCPECRAVGAQLSALQEAFHELEEAEVPEGFAQGVMERIQALESERKGIPWFRRPQVRALAGLAACLALAVGLYGASLSQEADKMDAVARGFSCDTRMEDGWTDSITDGAPQIAAYAASGGQGMEKATPIRFAFQNDQYLEAAYGCTPEPGARIIGSTQALEDFLAQFTWGDFSEVQAQYDQTYFKSGRLLAVVLEEPSESTRHQISELLRDQVIIEQTSLGRTGILGAWLILAEVDTSFNDGDMLTVTVIPWEDDGCGSESSREDRKSDRLGEG